MNFTKFKLKGLLSYFGNQWVQLWNQSGGVRSKIKNNKLTVSLY